MSKADDWQQSACGGMLPWAPTYGSFPPPRLRVHVMIGSGPCRSPHGVLACAPIIWAPSHSKGVPRSRAVPAEVLTVPRTPSGLVSHPSSRHTCTQLVGFLCHVTGSHAHSGRPATIPNSPGPSVTAVTTLSEPCRASESLTGSECRPEPLGPLTLPQRQSRRSRNLVSPGRDPRLFGRL